MLNIITEHTALIDNKHVCLSEIHEYLYENINDMHDNIKNKKYEKVHADLLLIQKHTFMSINRMHIHNVNKTITAVNKKINNRKMIWIVLLKKSNKHTNANNADNKITNANNANEKNTNANNINKKITNTNNTNEKITNATKK